jgi:hypothetical protein
MRRPASLVLVSLALGVSGAYVLAPRGAPIAPRIAHAEECPFCHKEITEGRGQFNCAECEKTANDIARSAPQWTLEFKHEKPRRIVVKMDERAPEAYWWFPYTLKNNDKDEHAFSVHIAAESDKGKNVAKYYDVAVPEVTADIRKLLGLKEGEPLWTQIEVTSIPPGQQHQPPATSTPPPGGESAKIALPVLKSGEQIKCAAMFRGLDPEMDKLTITVRGLSSDIEVETLEQPFRRKMRERVLELVYESPGDEFMAQTRPIKFVSQKWTEVEKTIKSDLR